MQAWAHSEDLSQIARGLRLASKPCILTLVYLQTTCSRPVGVDAGLHMPAAHCLGHTDTRMSCTRGGGGGGGSQPLKGAHAGQ
jgi:hypothetical protein